MTFQDPVPLTLSQQINQMAWVFLALVVAAPVSLVLAFCARWGAWPDLSFLIGGL